jgi:tetratricopeptide (TPR) repeat protein
MKRAVLVITLLFLLSAVTDAISIPLGQKAPDVSLARPEGGSIGLADFKGKTLVFIFWRTGQKRSIMALEDAMVVYDKYAKKGVEVIGAIEDSDDLEAAKKIYEEKGIKFPLVIDSQRNAYGAFGVRVYPTTVIIDGEGILTYDIPSHPLTYRTKLDGYVRKIIGEISEEELKAVLSPKKEEKDEATLEAERHYNLAMKFLKMRLMDQALDEAVKSVKARDDMARGHILVGFLYLNDGDADSAMKAFDRALEIDPSSNDAKTGKGGALVLKGEYDEAITILKEAAVANPYAQMTYYELGKAYEKKGENEEAIKMYRKAIEKMIHKKILPSSIARCQ